MFIVVLLLTFLGTFDPYPISSGALGTLVFRHVYDGLGRIIRKEMLGPGFTELRIEDYYYDGLRRVQDVEKRPYEPFEPCEFFEFSVKGQLVLAAEDPELQWLNAAGTPIEPVDPCDGLAPAHSQSGPTYETWCEREYVYGPDQLDELVLQIDRTVAVGGLIPKVSVARLSFFEDRLVPSTARSKE